MCIEGYCAAGGGLRVGRAVGLGFASVAADPVFSVPVKLLSKMCSKDVQQCKVRLYKLIRILHVA